jgi:hypothetical protein
MAIRRLSEFSGKVSSSKMSTMGVGSNDVGCNNFFKSSGATLLPVGPSTGIYTKKRKEISLVDDESEVENENDNDYSTTLTTENGSPVVFTPPYIQVQFECVRGRKHVGISMLLPSALGLNGKKLRPKVSADGTNIRIRMYHPQQWTSMKFHKKAMLDKGVSENIVGKMMELQAKEFRYLATLTESDSTKIMTFCNISLPFACEETIVNKIPVIQRGSDSVTYIIILRRVATEKDLKDDEEVETENVYGSSDESTVYD